MVLLLYILGLDLHSFLRDLSLVSRKFWFPCSLFTFRHHNQFVYDDDGDEFGRDGLARHRTGLPLQKRVKLWGCIR